MSDQNIEHPAFQGGRVPPQAVEVEESVLGAMLLEQGAAEKVKEMLEPYHFYKTAHRHIYEAITELMDKGRTHDLLSLEHLLKDKGLLAECGGSTALSDLTRTVSSTANVEHHCQIIIEKWIPRNIIIGANDLIRKSYDSTSDPYDLIDAAALFGKHVAERSFQTIPPDVSQFIEQMLRSMLHVFEEKTGIIGVPSCLPLDDLTAGFEPGNLYYVAARPSMGKTAFVLTAVIENIKRGYPRPIILFSYEMSKNILLMRLCCMMAKVNLEDARRGQLKKKDWNKLFRSLERLGFEGYLDDDGQLVIEKVEQTNLYIIDNNELDVDDVKAICRRILIEWSGDNPEKHVEAGLVITDYLQLMPVKNTRKKNIYNREQEIAYSSKNLKTIAKDLNVPVVALSQLSRAVEKRSGDNRPQLADLRESGSTEQDADAVIFLYRPEYYKIKTTPDGQSTNGLCEVEVAKQRNGPVGMKKHFFEKEFALFSSWEENDDKIPHKDVPEDNWESIDLDEDMPF